MSYDNIDWSEPLEDARAELERAVVGHRISDVELLKGRDNTLLLTLDDGNVVEVVGLNDCCAYGDVGAYVQKLPSLDHIITAVVARDDYQEWSIVADAGDVLDLEVAWSQGNGYYMYGLSVRVREVAP